MSNVKKLFYEEQKRASAKKSIDEYSFLDDYNGCRNKVWTFFFFQNVTGAKFRS